jgi:DNA-binding NarL/FixJ family response regulator
MIRVLIADDHPIVREGIARILERSREIVVAAEADSGGELLQLARTVEHDLVLLDLSMPQTDALEVLKQLKREKPRVPVLILTMYGESQFAIRALKAGAAGYLLKDSTPTELVTAVRKVRSGGRYLSPAIAESLASHLAADTEKPPHDLLSNREFQVMRLIAAGRSTREISDELSLSVKTISTYRTRIFEKMRMKRPAELAAYVVRHGLGD